MKEVTFVFNPIFWCRILEIIAMNWSCLLVAWNWLQVFVMFRCIIRNPLIWRLVVYWWLRVFKLYLMLNMICICIWLDLWSWPLDNLFTVIMKNHLPKSFIRLIFCFADWLGADIVLSLLVLGHHVLKKWLILRKLFNKGLNDCFKLWYFFLKMLTVLPWYLWLKLLNLNGIF